MSQTLAVTTGETLLAVLQKRLLFARRLRTDDGTRIQCSAYTHSIKKCLYSIPDKSMLLLMTEITLKT